ncbi:MAG: PAS domain S-box protein [Verrucomicrobiota bacterium]
MRRGDEKSLGQAAGRPAVQDSKVRDRFELVVESAPNGIIVSNAASKILMVNQQAEILFGYTREEFEKLAIEDLVPERLRAGHGKKREGFHDHPEPRAMGAGRDLYAERKDGTEFPVEIALTPIPGEKSGETYVLASIIDITERKKAEEALQRSTHELERSYAELEKSQVRLQLQAEILRNVHDAVFYMNPQGEILDWNEGAERIFGFGSDEIIGNTLRALCPCKGEDVFERRIKPAIETKGVATEVLCCRTVSGEEIYIRSKATLMAGGSVEGYVFCASDITNERRLEGEIVRVSEEEQKRIGQDLHDDLCSQLSGIGCLAKSLEQSLTQESHPEAELCSTISSMLSSAGNKAREIAKGLVPTVLETQGLPDAIKDLVGRLRDVYRLDCGAEVEGSHLSRRLDMKDAIQIFRIAQEALSNALKHSDAERIRVSLEDDGDFLILKVNDDGKGMVPDSESEGMGLITMQRRAEMISAEFRIDALPGEGTLIECRLRVLGNE